MTVSVPAVNFGVAASKPSAGKSVAAAVAPLRRLVLAAVEHVSATKGVPLNWIAEGSGGDFEVTDEASRKAWAIVAVGLLDALANGGSVQLAKAQRWFGDSASALALDPMDLSRAEAWLSQVVEHPSVGDLLPYILDGFGATSRLDVLRDGSRRGDRAARKEVGSFYTPSDVADFMVECVAGPEPENAVWLDPACGSGVFLVAVLRCLERRGLSQEAVEEFATTNLRGLDISPLATDFAAYAVIAHIGSRLASSPAEAWRKIRGNLVAVDALRVTARSNAPGHSLSIDDLFGARDEPLKVVCNPPYAGSGHSTGRRHWASLSNGSAATSLCLPFVEMAWKFDGSPCDSAAFVVPLSVATNRSSNHAILREELVRGGGEWTMLFFDRQPHALFGEDAKTRNVIMLRRQAEQFSVQTSRMLKWTSRQRPSIFTEGRAVPLRETSIKRLVPKLGSSTEVEFYERLTAYALRSTTRPNLSSIAPSEIAEAADERDVFVGGTAYNFLNVFRSYPAQGDVDSTLSSSKAHRLRFPTAELAAAGFALLSSRVSFWLWHVECDGFHVPAWFLDDLPLFDLSLSLAQEQQLSGLGQALWQASRQNMIASLNGGKRTFSFRPPGGFGDRHMIDEVIRAAVGDPGRFDVALGLFEEATTRIDGTDRAMRAGNLESKVLRMMSK